MIPDCPVCKKGTKRTHHGGTCTAMGWTPIYDENGNLTNCDPNIFTRYYQCEECKTHYAIKIQFGECFQIDYKDATGAFCTVKIPVEKTMIETKPKIGLLLGSDSDWGKIKSCAETLDEFNVPYEVNVMSAHRTPAKVAEYAETAINRGLRVIICAAGGAAHLAGVVASHTTLPIIGIPVVTEFGGGLDSLLSTVQMPGDIAVATVGSNSGGPRNAAILAVQILAYGGKCRDPDYSYWLEEFRKKLPEKIEAKNEALKKKIAEGTT